MVCNQERVIMGVYTINIKVASRFELEVGHSQYQVQNPSGHPRLNYHQYQSRLNLNKLTFEMRRWVISQQRGAFFTRGRWVFVCRGCSAPFFPVFHDMSKRQFCMIFHGFHHKKLGVEINERVQQNLRGMGTQLFGFLEKKGKKSN